MPKNHLLIPKNHLLIIDALNLIRRVHAVQINQNTDPKAQITATRETIKHAVNKLLAITAPTHVVAVFDAEQTGWRHQVYPEYKANRKPMPAELQQALPAIQDDLWQLNIDSLLTESDEADDLIATLAMKMSAQQQQVTIISTDKGYCQLLTPYIQIRDYFNKRWLDQHFIDDKFGVQPEQLTDYWGLTGISGSHLAGVAGIGPKTATQLLNQYPNLDQIYASTTLKQSLREKLDKHKEMAYITQQLALLKTDIPLGFNLKDLRYQP